MSEWMTLRIIEKVLGDTGRARIRSLCNLKRDFFLQISSIYAPLYVVEAFEAQGRLPLIIFLPQGVVEIKCLPHPFIASPEALPERPQKPSGSNPAHSKSRVFGNEMPSQSPPGPLLGSSAWKAEVS